MLDGNEMQVAMKTADTLSRSGLVPRAVQGKPPDVLVILLTGRELGLGPMQALRSIHVVEGKPTLSADLMQAICLSRRDVCEYFRQVESTKERAVYVAKRAGDEPVTLAFTMQQAKDANLTGKQNWRLYPDAMLRARCKAALARDVFPDLMAGLYTPEELNASEPLADRPAPELRKPALPEPQDRDTLEWTPAREPVAVPRGGVIFGHELRRALGEDAEIEEPAREPGSDDGEPDEMEREVLAIRKAAGAAQSLEDLKLLKPRTEALGKGSAAYKAAAKALRDAHTRIASKVLS